MHMTFGQTLLLRTKYIFNENMRERKYVFVSHLAFNRVRASFVGRHISNRINLWSRIHDNEKNHILLLQSDRNFQSKTSTVSSRSINIPITYEIFSNSNLAFCISEITWRILSMSCHNEWVYHTPKSLLLKIICTD